MSFDKLWQKSIAANPGLADPENSVKLTVAELRSLLERAYNCGWDDSQVEQKGRPSNGDRSETKWADF